MDNTELTLRQQNLLGDLCASLRETVFAVREDKDINGGDLVDMLADWTQRWNVTPQELDTINDILRKKT